MKKWNCTKCGYTVRAIATQVAHRCPANRNLVTEFREEKEADDE
jgi:predicted Zn-ribbon and HTH transcriptional regulator